MTPCSRIENCLFQICARTRVAAAEELQDFETQLQHVAVADRTPSQTEMLATLRRVQKEEEEMNKQTQEDKIGEVLKYGEIIQLRHVVSGKTLSIQPNVIADLEPDNVKCCLSSAPTASSWVTIKPAVAFYSDGQAVLNKSSVHLCVTSEELSALHISDTENPIGDPLKQLLTDFQTKFELNASLAWTAFTVERYAKAYKEDSSLDIRSGDLVTL